MKQDLLDVTIEGTQKAIGYIIADKKLTVDWTKRVPIQEAMKKVMAVDYFEMVDTLKDAIDMGEPMQRVLINTYCNSMAVKVLKEAGILNHSSI